MLYFPPKDTAGFATSEVKTPRRLPCPPANNMAIISFRNHKITPLFFNCWCYQFTKRLSSSEINCLTVKAHKCSLVNRRLGNCNLLVLVVIIAHLFQKVNNLQKKNYAFLFICYSSRVMLRKPLGAMVSSPDQTPQVPVIFFFIIHYFERPAPSVRLVKSIHLRALPQILRFCE